MYSKCLRMQLAWCHHHEMVLICRYLVRQSNLAEEFYVWLVVLPVFFLCVIFVSNDRRIFPKDENHAEHNRSLLTCNHDGGCGPDGGAHRDTFGRLVSFSFTRLLDLVMTFTSSQRALVVTPPI